MLHISDNFSVPNDRVLKIQNYLLEAFPDELKSK